MQENKVIACLLHAREAYDKLVPFFDKIKTFTVFGSKVLQEITKFYETDPTVQYADVDIIKQRLIAENPKKDFIIEEYFAGLPNNVSVENVVKLYEDLYKDTLRLELIQSLNNKDDETTNKLIEQLQTVSLEEDEEGLFNATSVEDLAEHFTGNNLIPIYPSAINTILGGGVPRQSQVCIFARPDVGKSVVAINLCVAAAEHGFKVLYVGNEDAPSVMMMRVMSRFLRKPKDEILKTPDKSLEEALRRGYDRVFFKEMHPGNYKELRKYIEKVNPDVFIVDQIRNMHFKPESMTVNLEQGVIATRNLAKEFNCVSVVITQAGDSATNKVVLTKEDVEWSNTGVAAQADLMIGVGQNAELRDQGMVVLSFPKNKFTAPIPPISASIDYAINRLTIN